jgi:hypothetical protein
MSDHTQKTMNEMAARRKEQELARKPDQFGVQDAIQKLAYSTDVDWFALYAWYLKHITAGACAVAPFVLLAGWLLWGVISAIYAANI